MCGIVGYIGNEYAPEIILDALEKLEYRGYDSAGLACWKDKKINIVKTKGKIANLRNSVATEMDEKQFFSDIGLGHTRWATHGEPNEINSHPHISASGSVAIVHNGIIENYVQLRLFLERKGYKFVSETDSEAIAHLLEYCYDGNPIKAVKEAAAMLKGAYAVCALFREHPDMLIALRRDSPLIIGLCEDSNMIASDIPALLRYTRKIIRLEEGDLAVIYRDKVELINSKGMPIEPSIQFISWDTQTAERDGYEHFMLKEIFQQPETVHKTVGAYSSNSHIDFSLNCVDDDYIRYINSICIVACGSAYHAGVVGQAFLESILRIPVRVYIASEFNYCDPILDEKTLSIFVSQSGETIDTLHALRLAKRKRSKTLAIVNVVGSSIAAESDDIIYTHAGPEIAVATTKAYSAQLTVFYMLCAYMTRVRYKDLSIERDCLQALQKLPVFIEDLLATKSELDELANEYHDCDNIFFIGRNIDYALALEGSLKLKEISYLHSEAYAAGELKHGTISLIEPGTLIVALCTHLPLVEKMVSNISEVKSRGARILAIAIKGTQGVEEVADHVIWLPKTPSFIQPSLTIVPMQLFAYTIAKLNGCDIDKPRNLAKSVTVE